MNKENIDYAVEKLSSLAGDMGTKVIEYEVFQLYIRTGILWFFTAVFISVAINAYIRDGKDSKKPFLFFIKEDDIDFGLVALMLGIASVLFLAASASGAYEIYLANTFPEMWSLETFIKSR